MSARRQKVHTLVPGIYQGGRYQGDASKDVADSDDDVMDTEREREKQKILANRL
jgi:hypothetical protein